MNLEANAEDIEQSSILSKAHRLFIVTYRFKTISAFEFNQDI